MKIVQVLGSSAGGVIRHVSAVAVALAARGDDVRVAGPASSRALLDETLQLATVEIGPRPGPGDLAAVRALRATMAGADVVHAHGLRAGAFAVIAARTRSSRPRVVVTLHNLPVGGRAVRAVSAVLERVVARGADVVLGVSGDLVARAERLGARGAERALVPAPVVSPVSDQDVAATRDALGVPGPLVLTVARLAPQKGLDTLLEAAAQLASVVPDVTWCVAGDGPLRVDLEDEVRRRALPVRMLGARSDVAALLRAADVVVSTAVWEGQPIAVQEALGAGAALVVTDAGGTREVTGEEAAVVVPVGDATALARETATLLVHDDVRAGQRERAARRARGLPTSADVVAQLERVYR